MKYLYTFLLGIIITFTANSQELLSAGDFDSGDNSPWGTPPGEIKSYDGGINYLYEANVAAAGNAWDVNLSHAVTLAHSEFYTLSFTANTGLGQTRDMIVGIGEAGGSYAGSTVTVDLTETNTTYTYILKYNDEWVDTGRVLFDMGADVGVVQIDNVSLQVYNYGTVPTSAPTAPPTRDAADVISIFGDAYGTENGLSDVVWDTAGLIEQTIAGTRVLKVNFNATGSYLGADLGAAIDASGMTHVHFDYYHPEDYVAGQVVNLDWSNHFTQAETDADAANAGQQNKIGINTEEITSAADVQVWKSVDYAIAAGAERDNIKQMTLNNTPGSTNTVYLANIYFYKDESAGGGGGETPTTTTYCDTEVTHLNIEAETASKIVLTIENSGADQITISASAAGDKAIDNLYVGAQPAGTPTASALDITNGVASFDLTWATGTMPATVTFELLWSVVDFGGNWMVNSGTETNALGNIDTANDCSTQSVKDISFYNIDVYPNPASNVINVRSEFAIDNLSVLDLMGRTVKQQISNNKEFSLDVSGLAKGIYLVKLSSGEKEAVTKFIKK